MIRLFVFIPLLTIAIALSSPAAIINVPGEYSAIQAGIDASSPGDTVLVQPGTYLENINYNGRNIVVGSLFLTSGDIVHIQTTIIDGHSAGTVVLMESGETNSAALIGFTLIGGNGSFGGGISCASGSNPLIAFNIIKQNSAGQSGGGISCWQNCDPLIKNTVIYGNSTASFGGGISLSANCDPVISNCVIAGNTAPSAGGAGISSWSSNPVISNTIIWGNNSDQITGTVSITYSDIQGGWSGQGNINQNPLFRDPAAGDYHLMAISCGSGSDSPCIDSGDPDLTETRLECIWGLGTNLCDMGAFGAVLAPGGGGGCVYVVGDINGDGTTNGLDVVYLVNFLKGGPPPPDICDCPPHGDFMVTVDVNGSCSINGLDVTYLVGYFKGGPNLIPCADCPPTE